jgi:hypothetical protein
MPRSLRLLAVLTVLVLGLVGSAGADPVEDTTTFFLANAGADCGTGDQPFLTTQARTNDINCGYIGGGLPIGEVFNATGLGEGRVFATRASAGGVPFVVDAARDVDGVITVRRGSQQGVGLPGGGQIVADIGLRVRAGTTWHNLGSQTLEAVAVPGGERVELPFTFDVPDTLDGATITGAEFDLDVRGVHLWHGFMELNGRSSFTVPTVVETTE